MEEQVKPEESQVKSTPVRTERPLSIFNGVLLIIVMSAVILAATFVMIGHQEQQRIVSVDSASIITEHLLVLQRRNLSPDEYRKEAERFMTSFNAAITAYSENGYTVLNSAAVIASPPGTDITLEVSEKVGNQKK